MRKAIYVIIALLVCGLVAFQLYSNKQEMKENLTIASKTVDAIPVTLGETKYETINRSFEANGFFQPLQDLTLMSETSGKVINVYAKKGQEVKKGQLLAQVDDDLLKANLMTAKAAFEKSKKDLARFENLAEGEAITKRQLEDAQLGFQNAEAHLIIAQKQYDNARILSPISGIINEDYVEIGSFVGPGTKLFDIVNVKQLKLSVKVSENDILLVKDGAVAKVKVNVYPEKSFIGIVSAIGVKADNSLKYEVEILVDNAENIIKAGMYGSSFFEIKESSKGLLIDRKAIAESLKDPKVYVINDEKAHLKSIVIGNSYEDKVEVLQGLEEGEKVVTSGQINLKEGVKVTVL